MNMGILLEPQRTQLLQLCGAASRAVLEDRHERRIRSLVCHPDWRPLPSLCSTWLVEPMILHHTSRMGIPPADVFEAPPDADAIFEQCAGQYYQRMIHLMRLLEAFREARLGRIMLIQGTALAPLYPAPALRRMFDLDLVIQPGNEEKVRGVLRQMGWRATSGNWVHQTGINLDLHVPETGLAKLLWRNAVQHPSYPEDLHVVMPEISDHLVYLALHTAKHTGDRLWRDLSDIHLLLDNGRRHDLVERALEKAMHFAAGPALSAVLRLLNRWGMPMEKMPERPAAGWTSREENEAEKHASIYEELATESVTSTALDLLESFKGLSPKKLLKWKKKRQKQAAASGVRRDPLLGEIPPAGSFSLHVLKLKIVEEAFRHQQLSRYWNLIRARQSIRRGVDDFKQMHG